MVLTPRIVDSVDLPVVTVGGIADGRSLAAALTLGAQGVMMASRFIATTECEVHDNIKKEIIARQEFETTMICKSLGLQGRALKNRVSSDVLELERKGGGLDQLIPLISGTRIKEAWEKGLVDDAPLMVGQSIGHIHGIVSCKELLDTMHDEAVAHMKRAMSLVQ
jgi:nitronate monooxygenase